MDGSVLKKEWLANREPKPPGELPGKVWTNQTDSQVSPIIRLYVYVLSPVYLMYYLCADLSDFRVNTRPQASWAPEPERHLLHVSPESGLSRHLCLALDQRLFTSAVGRLS